MALTVLKTSAWYSNARQLDLQRRTRLGTLGYLPWEVRQQIWELLIERATSWPYVARLNAGNLCGYFGSRPVVYNGSTDHVYLNQKSSKVIEIECYNYGTDSLLYQFRKVSLTVEYDFDALLFSTRILHFNCPHLLSKFIAQLSPFQRRHFFHLSINLFTPCRCCEPVFCCEPGFYENIRVSDLWLKTFAFLPPGLRNIFVDIGDKNNREPSEQSLFRWDDLKGKYRAVSKKIFLESMEIFVYRAKRCVPNATFSMQQWHLEHMYQGALGKLESIFHQLNNP